MTALKAAAETSQVERSRGGGGRLTVLSTLLLQRLALRCKGPAFLHHGHNAKGPGRTFKCLQVRNSADYSQTDSLLC